MFGTRTLIPAALAAALLVEREQWRALGKAGG